MRKDDIKEFTVEKLLTRRLQVLRNTTHIPLLGSISVALTNNTIRHFSQNRNQLRTPPAGSVPTGKYLCLAAIF